jgi:hypothetical protein
MRSAVSTSVPKVRPSSCCAAATSWWCLSHGRPISSIVETISPRMSIALSTGATGK